MGRNDIIDIELIVLHETDRAFLVKADEDGEKVWLPKSVAKRRDDVGMSGGAPIALFQVAEWLLIAKGLV